MERELRSWYDESIMNMIQSQDLKSMRTQYSKRSEQIDMLKNDIESDNQKLHDMKTEVYIWYTYGINVPFKTWMTIARPNLKLIII